MEEWISKIKAEYEQATQKFGKFNSTHEGYGVIKEEFDELWDEIKANSSKEVMEKEAIQLAAMSLRFLVDCCETQPPAAPDSEGRCPCNLCGGYHKGDTCPYYEDD